MPPLNCHLIFFCFFSGKIVAKFFCCNALRDATTGQNIFYTTDFYLKSPDLSCESCAILHGILKRTSQQTGWHGTLSQNLWAWITTLPYQKQKKSMEKERYIYSWQQKKLSYLLTQKGRQNIEYFSRQILNISTSTSPQFVLDCIIGDKILEKPKRKPVSSFIPSKTRWHFIP